MKTSVFWAKLYLFLNIIAFEGDTFGIAIFQHFDALSVVRNVQTFEIRLGFRDDFLIRSESLSLELPLKVWEQIIVWGPSLENTVGEQPIRIVIGPIWPSLSRTCVTVCYHDGIEFFLRGPIWGRFFFISSLPITLHNTLP